MPFKFETEQLSLTCQQRNRQVASIIQANERQDRAYTKGTLQV